LLSTRSIQGWSPSPPPFFDLSAIPVAKSNPDRKPALLSVLSITSSVHYTTPTPSTLAIRIKQSINQRKRQIDA
jgi:hypothetical protein